MARNQIEKQGANNQAEYEEVRGYDASIMTPQQMLQKQRAMYP